ncbi:DUF368 domain-containing protein [Tenacibaculum sp. ZS6-P6]|uniref:DUF368 domain-containing protein n=1 Tax=Tenacibaculum sp. ZS6-P6 TaxID=3447503 RepID=UPI003F97D1FF
MIRTTKNYIVLALKGMAMGAADVVPGVSGGTIAFISGIYEELLQSISNINLSLFKTLKEEGFKTAWKQLNGNFLLALFTGIFISVLSLAKIISWLLETQPILVWSFFFGLVLASVIYIGKQIKKWSVLSFVLLVSAAVAAYIITTLPPLVSESSSNLFLFLSGAIAICAMILPGISGSFILVLLGAYKPILNAVSSRDFVTVFFVALGSIVGLLSFSRVLKWLFANYKNYTLAALTGFIIGSLNKIWPWKKVLTYRINSHGEKEAFNELSISPFSYEGDPQLLYAIILSIVGFSLIILLEKLAVKK